MPVLMEGCVLVRVVACACSKLVLHACCMRAAGGCCTAPAGNQRHPPEDEWLAPRRHLVQHDHQLARQAAAAWHPVPDMMPSKGQVADARAVRAADGGQWLAGGRGQVEPVVLQLPHCEYL